MIDDRDWTFVIPVDALYLTKAVDREFRIDRVTFIHRDKLPRVRRKKRERLGFGLPVSELKKRPLAKELLERSPSLALTRVRGTREEEVEQRCLKLVREELSLLTLSRLGYSNRRQMAAVVPAGGVSHASVNYMVARSADMTGRLMARRTAPIRDLWLDERWKVHQDYGFFTKLLKILREETDVEDEWRVELRRASVMIGESVGADDLLKSFVWNWAALETLLTRRRDRVGETLPKRVEAILGWVLFWEAENYGDRIVKVYRKRNALMHGSERSTITLQDLAFTDHLLLNLLYNFASLPKLFGSKEEVIAFSERLEAERTLGIKPKVRPKNLRFMRPAKPDF